ncbi:methylated-DNA--[protein]-cysteine S-methyltransferase [Arachnia propionica]|uniref:methylated-DNA--[protein]-cysteine S-methyltransferase n=1 Tax=Arachnia propionica TaxID=1750 RepID=A0A3P1WUX7_9ACTN|nr:methylated-DNA--[protein]-cysteine S-methyltransferase [Arachnia propionica]RRD49708.1 methylated-DNA--[protein]-cysteine S-methyltransferase [Arachnia propionica]
MRQLTIELPGGPWTFIVDGEVLVRGLHGGGSEGFEPVPRSHPVAQALRAYADGEVTAIDSIPVSQPEGDFRAAVRREMRRIPPGETVSYRELAAWAGNAAAARAAAAACARNLIPVVVPCHRVVRSDGTLGGYAFGLEVKQALLDFERRSGQRPGVASDLRRTEMRTASR